ncbi:MAG: hypothetical protein IPM18_09985 [Phycisphaerales bacterium]|nr:hypothetical protein [Phycisphaerales bacterium]
MLRRKILPAVAAAALLGTLVGGCPFGDPRLNNQGGTNLLQAAGKIAGDRLHTLNPDDIQILTDLALQVTEANFPPATDEQAQAVVDFIKANGITTVASLQDLIARAEQDPDSIVIPDSVREVLDAIADNPGIYIDAWEGTSN